MKKLVFGLLSLAVIATLYVLIGAMYRVELYDAAMAFERSNAGLVESELTIGNISVSYLEEEVKDDQPVLLLVHGFAANKENWLRFAGYMKDQYHIVALDLLGHGKSTKDSTLSHGIDDQVAYLIRFLNEKGIQRVHLAGNSMGGAIAALFAAQHPNRTQTVILVNPAGVHDHRSVLDDFLDKGENPLVIKEPKDVYTLLNFAMEVKPFVPWPIPVVVAERSMANKALNEQIFERLKEAGDTLDFKNEITKIEAPTLIMWGTEDRIINYRNADVFEALIPNSKKLIYSAIGHVPMIEIPEQSAKDVKSFINTNKQN